MCDVVCSMPVTYCAAIWRYSMTSMKHRLSGLLVVAVFAKQADSNVSLWCKA